MRGDERDVGTEHKGRWVCIRRSEGHQCGMWRTGSEVTWT